MGQIGQAFDHITSNKEITELSAVLYADSFFCGFWSKDDRLMKSESFPVEEFDAKLRSWNSNYPEADLKILSTKVPYVHLPQSYYDQEYFEDYFKGIFDLRKRKRHEKELDNFIKEEIHTLHYIDKKVVDSLNSNALAFKMAHISTAMSNYCSASEVNLIVFMEGRNLHIVCQKEGTFRFYNQFYCVDVNDYLYFILMVIQNFGADSTEMQLNIAGEIDRTSKLYTQLRAYFPDMKILDDQFEISGTVSSPAQAYFDLFLCKSCV